MSRSRLGIVVLVAGAILAALFYERSEDTATRTRAEQPSNLSRLAPTAAPADALGSTWYCAAGSAGEFSLEPPPAAEEPDDTTEDPADTTNDADAENDAAEDESPDNEEEDIEPQGPVRADHTLVMANPTQEDRTASVTIHPGTAKPQVVDIDLAASSVERLALGDLVDSPAAAALVEADGGGVVVSHHIEGPAGADSGPCASVSSDTWYFAWGDTSRDARHLVSLFNPFPGDAVVDFTFMTDDGVRQPQALAGMVVPGRSVIVADVGAEVTRREQVSTSVTTRSGRVIAERIQAFDGSEGRGGLAIELGAPDPAPTWAYPVARTNAGLPQRLVVYNPGDQPAEVDVEVLVDTETVVGGVEPFELTIPGGEYRLLNLAEEGRLLDVFGEDSAEFTAVVRSLNNVPVVSEMVTFEADGKGVASTTGTPVVARQQIIADPTFGSPRSSRLRLANLEAEEPVEVSVQFVAQGGWSTVEDGDVVVDPAGRVTVELSRLPARPGVLVLTAPAPFVAELVNMYDEPADLATINAVLTTTGLTAVPSFSWR